MYMQVGDFCVGRGSPRVPLTQISCNTVFSRSQNVRKAGTLCSLKTAIYHSQIFADTLYFLFFLGLTQQQPPPQQNRNVQQVSNGRAQQQPIQERQNQVQT